MGSSNFARFRAHGRTDVQKRKGKKEKRSSFFYDGKRSGLVSGVRWLRKAAVFRFRRVVALRMRFGE